MPGKSAPEHRKRRRRRVDEPRTGSSSVSRRRKHYSQRLHRSYYSTSVKPTVSASPDLPGADQNGTRLHSRDLVGTTDSKANRKRPRRRSSVALRQPDVGSSPSRRRRRRRFRRQGSSSTLGLSFSVANVPEHATLDSSFDTIDRSVSTNPARSDSELFVRRRPTVKRQRAPDVNTAPPDAAFEHVRGHSAPAPQKRRRRRSQSSRARSTTHSGSSSKAGSSRRRRRRKPRSDRPTSPTERSSSPDTGAWRAARSGDSGGTSSYEDVPVTRGCARSERSVTPTIVVSPATPQYLPPPRSSSSSPRARSPVAAIGPSDTAKDNPGTKAPAKRRRRRLHSRARSDADGPSKSDATLSRKEHSEPKRRRRRSHSRSASRTVSQASQTETQPRRRRRSRSRSASRNASRSSMQQEAQQPRRRRSRRSPSASGRPASQLPVTASSIPARRRRRRSHSRSHSRSATLSGTKRSLSPHATDESAKRRRRRHSRSASRDRAALDVAVASAEPGADANAGALVVASSAALVTAPNIRDSDVATRFQHYLTERMLAAPSRRAGVAASEAEDAAITRVALYDAVTDFLMATLRRELLGEGRVVGGAMRSAMGARGTGGVPRVRAGGASRARRASAPPRRRARERIRSARGADQRVASFSLCRGARSHSVKEPRSRNAGAIEELSDWSASSLLARRATRAEPFMAAAEALADALGPGAIAPRTPSLPPGEPLKRQSPSPPPLVPPKRSPSPAREPPGLSRDDLDTSGARRRLEYRERVHQSLSDPPVRYRDRSEPSIGTRASRGPSPAHTPERAQSPVRFTHGGDVVSRPSPLRLGPSSEQTQDEHGDTRAPSVRPRTPSQPSSRDSSPVRVRPEAPMRHSPARVRPAPVREQSYHNHSPERVANEETRRRPARLTIDVRQSASPLDPGQLYGQEDQTVPSPLGASAVRFASRNRGSPPEYERSVPNVNAPAPRSVLTKSRSRSPASRRAHSPHGAGASDDGSEHRHRRRRAFQTIGRDKAHQWGHVASELRARHGHLHNHHHGHQYHHGDHHHDHHHGGSSGDHHNGHNHRDHHAHVDETRAPWHGYGFDDSPPRRSTHPADDERWGSTVRAGAGDRVSVDSTWTPERTSAGTGAEDTTPVWPAGSALAEWRRDWEMRHSDGAA